MLTMIMVQMEDASRLKALDIQLFYVNCQSIRGIDFGWKGSFVLSIKFCIRLVTS